MAVHVPLSIEAQVESRALMMSTNNILSPASGKPIIVPTQDMVLGLYYMTRERPLARGEGKFFSPPSEVRIAYDHDEVDLHARITVRMPVMRMAAAAALETRGRRPSTGRRQPRRITAAATERVETTVGRVLLYEIVPPEVPFSEVNKTMKKKELGNLIDLVYRRAGNKATVIFADRLKDVGFEFATRAGISISIKDMTIPPRKKAHLLDGAQKQVSEIQQQYNNGVITDGERYNKVVDIWAEVQDEIGSAVLKGLSTQVFRQGQGRQGSDGAVVQPDLHHGRLRARAVPSSRFASWRDCAA